MITSRCNLAIIATLLVSGYLLAQDASTALIKVSTEVSGYSHQQPIYLKGQRIGAYGTVLKDSVNYRSAAADWSVLPLGTVFQIKGDVSNTRFIVDDHLPELVGTSHVKIYFGKPKEAKDWGKQTLELQILRKGKYKESYLILQKAAGRDPYSYTMANTILKQFQEMEKLAAQRLKFFNLPASRTAQPPEALINLALKDELFGASVNRVN